MNQIPIHEFVSEATYRGEKIKTFVECDGSASSFDSNGNLLAHTDLISSAYYFAKLKVSRK